MTLKQSEKITAGYTQIFYYFYIKECGEVFSQSDVRGQFVDRLFGRHKYYDMTYDIFLDDKKIGTSLLEHADAPMGCVNGQIIFLDKKLDYDFFSKYCKDNNVKADEYPEDKFISTQAIPALKVLNEKGTEIKGVSCYIAGMDSDGYEINIIGIPYPFYGEEFPHHRKAYDDQFSQTKKTTTKQ